MEEAGVEGEGPVLDVDEDPADPEEKDEIAVPCAVP